MEFMIKVFGFMVQGRGSKGEGLEFGTLKLQGIRIWGLKVSRFKV